MQAKRRWPLSLAALGGAVLGAAINLVSMWLRGQMGEIDAAAGSILVAAIVVACAATWVAWMRNFMAGL